MAAVSEADTHGNGANVEILRLHHINGLHNFLMAEIYVHGITSNSVHISEDVFVLGLNFHAQFFAGNIEFLLKFFQTN